MYSIEWIRNTSEEFRKLENDLLHQQKYFTKEFINLILNYVVEAYNESYKLGTLKDKTEKPEKDVFEFVEINVKLFMNAFKRHTEALMFDAYNEGFADRVITDKDKNSKRKFTR